MMDLEIEKIIVIERNSYINSISSTVSLLLPLVLDQDR